MFCLYVFRLTTTSVVRYSRYLDTYRQYLRDDTSIAKSRYTVVYRSSKAVSPICKAVPILSKAGSPLSKAGFSLSKAVSPMSKAVSTE